MDAKRKRDNIIAIAVVGFAAVWLLASLGIFDIAASEFPERGVVLSVSGVDAAREAVVRLDSGAEVRAEVPSQCVVFAGYVATIYRTQAFSISPKYRVLSATEKNDT